MRIGIGGNRKYEVITANKGSNGDIKRNNAHKQNKIKKATWTAKKKAACLPVTVFRWIDELLSCLE